MISLRIRKVVDTSEWDQSFVDGGGGQGSSLTAINVKRPTSGDGLVISGSAAGAWNRKEIEEEERTSWQEVAASAYDDDSCRAVPLESHPAAGISSSSRHINPFLNGGLSTGCGQSRAYRLVERKSGIGLNCRKRGNELRHGEQEFNISARDLDASGRQTLPVGDVTAWLNSIKLLDASKLSLSRSTSRSSPPPPPVLCDDDLLALKGDRTKVNGGKRSQFNGEPPVFEGRSPVFQVRSPDFKGRSPVFEGRSPLFEGRTPVFQGRSPDFKGRSPLFEGRSPVFEGQTPDIEGLSETNMTSPATLEGRTPSVFGDRSGLVRTPVFEGWTVAFEGRGPELGRRTPAFEGRASAFEGRSPAFEGRPPVFEGRSPAFEGRSPAFEVHSPAALNGRTPFSNGRFSFFEGLQSSSSNIRSPTTIQTCPASALNVEQSNQTPPPPPPSASTCTTEVPMAYSRAVSFLPSWDLERLETVYRRLDACGFYFGQLTMDEARLRLTGYPVGTFLLRDSSDPRFIFSLSIQTRRGTTSIRVLYEAGLFRLDSDPDQSHLMSTFECVLHLVRHYVRLSSGRRSPVASVVDSPPTAAVNSYVLRESTGRRDTPVLLRRPLETTPATLGHSCRKSIHRSLGDHPLNVSRLHLKPSLKEYLSLYPYDI